MTFDASSFASYRKLNSGKKIRFGNNQYGMGIGVGDIVTISQLPDGSTRKVTSREVLHVPELGRKLVSIAAATSNGAQGQISEGKIVLVDANNKPIVVAHKCGNLYRADIQELSADSH